MKVGQPLGHYEIISTLGKGGMGEVYLARDTKLGRKVALKFIPENFTKDEDRLRRFDQEARAASALNHPSILTIHEIGQIDEAHFIATEFVEGETVRSLLIHSRPGVRETLEMAIQIASALVAAHRAGIVHRDIKPENIMLRHDGILKVLDFGLAKLTAGPEPPEIDSQLATRPQPRTDPGMVVGTINYMSPEQARGKVVDARTDIFSLGAVLYEMLTGNTPFPGETKADVLGNLMTKDPQPLTESAPGIPAELHHIVSKALRKDRDARYQTAKSLLVDLEALKQDLDFAAKLERTSGPRSEVNKTATTSNTRQIFSRVREHKLILAGTVLFLFAAICLGYWFFSHRQSTAGQIESVAVMPFVNESGNADNDYLSDGLTESLINSLSHLPGMKVIARSSSFKYKGKEFDLQQVARALDVAGVVTGRVTQRGDTLLISVELVDARDKTVVWGEQYNRKATDLLALQSDISREIAETLRLHLTVGEQQYLAQRETTSPQAYELLLKARFYNLKGGTENQKKAIEYYQKAIAVDPKYALAYAELSGSYRGLVLDSILDPKEGSPKAEAAARKALELDESLAEAHLALAGLRQTAWDWAAAEREYRKAIQLNANLAAGRHAYATYLSLMGRHDQAIAEVTRARELDPLSLSVNLGVGVRLSLARQYDQAIEALKKTLELDQNYAPAHIFLGYNYASKGMYPEAIAAYQKFIELSGDDSSVQVSLGMAYASAGQREKAQAILKRLLTTKEYVSPAELATLYAALGEREQAFASLEKAYAARDPQLQYLLVDPSFDPLRSDPRLKDLIRRIGLPQ